MTSPGSGSTTRCVRRRTAIAAVALHTVACASSFEPAAPRALTPIASSAPSGLSLIWRNTELQPISQPIAIGDVVLGVVVNDRKAFVVSIDPATGRMLWRQRVTQSATPARLSATVRRVGDDKVVFLQMIHEDTRFANLVVADAHTGKELARSPAAFFPSVPVACSNERDVCVIANLPDEPRRQYRLDVTTGAFVAEYDRLLRRTRLVQQSGLIDLGDRPGNTLALLRNGTVRWLTPLGAGFPSTHSTDHGWQFDLYRDQHVFVGALWPASVDSDDYIAIDLATAAMAGISEHTGEVLWRDAGSSFECNINSGDYPVRCRQRGRYLHHRGTGAAQVVDLDATLEGFDPATGKTTWSLPMGATPMEANLAPHPAIAGLHQVALQSPNGPVVLDYATGTLKPPEPGATFWCLTSSTYELSPPYRLRTAVWSYLRTGGSLAYICDQKANPATALPSVAATTSTGACTGHYTVIATSDGYLGFKLP